MRPELCPVDAAACVDLTNEETWLQRRGEISYGPVSITSGREGYLTEPGEFTVFYKNKDHQSTIFNWAPMPFATFFDGDNAFHEGSLSVQSHGCIHLDRNAAETYWDALHRGDVVVVFGAAPYGT